MIYCPRTNVRFTSVCIEATYWLVDQPHSIVRCSQLRTDNRVQNRSVACSRDHCGASVPSRWRHSIVLRQPSRIADIRSFQAIAAATLPGQEQLVAGQLVWLFWNARFPPPIGPVILVADLAWVTAMIASAVALRRAGASWLIVGLLVVAGIACRRYRSACADPALLP
jgi:hypothetical protein